MIRLTTASRLALESLGDGEWHDISGVAVAYRCTACNRPCTECACAHSTWTSTIAAVSPGVWRRLDKLGLIERQLARGAWYGVNHPTRARITDRGWAALAANIQPTVRIAP